MLRRERKRRLEAAEQFRDGGRPELADQEESEAKLIAGYLPAELSDDELDQMIAAAIAETRRLEPQGHGPGDEGGDGRVGRPRRRQAGLGAGARGAGGLDGGWGAAQR